jgi:hypothetical protein
MPDILSPSDYAQVRYVLDLSLDDTSLPDSKIGLGVFVDAAEAEVKTLDPDWAAHLADVTTADPVVWAAVYLTAARIVPSLPNLTSNSFADERHTRAAFDPATRAAELRAKAVAVLVPIVADTSPVVATGETFSLACGRRGR